jgi:exo-beta-1,3-glucanase (GH17 family)
MKAVKVKVVYRDDDVMVIQLNELIPRSDFIIVVGNKAWLVRANAKELEEFLVEKINAV